MGLENQLVPWRFFTTLGHFLCIMLIFSNHEDSATSASQRVNLLSGVWMSIAFIAVEFVGLFSGLTLFHHTSNQIYIACHALGIVLIAFFLGLTWPHWSYWFIFISSSLLSGSLEIINIIKIVVCQTRKY